ncbi:MAG: GNAT family N-acetyltransferase [Thermaerobacter sp.]|nr:GNAT family N-acetyltransferase [Thermaerobacter sp.]
MQIWRGAGVRDAIGRSLGPDAIVVGRPGRPSPSWLAALPFGPDQFFLGGPSGPRGGEDLTELLALLLSALPQTAHRIYHYDPTWSAEVEQAFMGAGFQDFVHRYTMWRPLPAPSSPDPARLTFEALRQDNESAFIAAYTSCLVGCLSPMSREDADDPSAALRFQMQQDHGPGGRQWLLARTASGDAAGIALLDRYGPQLSDWVVTFVGTTETYRGRGYGRELLSSAAARATRAGARTLYLAVCQTNTPAVSLYRRLGFRTRETYRVFRKAHPTAFVTDA